MIDCPTDSLTKKDFESDQTVKWCAGCGNYAILNAIQNALPKMGKRREDIVFISGIGCSSRLTYYMNTYGFHTLHGRPIAVASGIKMTNPGLSVWIVTGDGDALAIGGNHFIHLLRRNLNVNVLLFNNQIYGLTKGQFSPTTKLETITKTSPYGNIENPFSPGELAISAKGTFYARVIDSNPKFMQEIFINAEKHNGTALIEILQNCVIFNDGIYSSLKAKETKEEYQIHLEHGNPMIFGKEKNKGLRLNGLKLEVVKIGENGITENNILIHDAHESEPTLHLLLAGMQSPQYPVAVGIIRDIEAPVYEEKMMNIINKGKANTEIKSVDDMFFSGKTWEIK